MLPPSILALALGLLFVVPGFLVIQTKRRLYVVSVATPFQETMGAVTISALLLGTLEALFRSGKGSGFLLVDESKLTDLLTNGLMWKRYVFTLTIAMVLGLLWALLLKSGFPQLVYNLGFRVGVAPTPWDELFSRDNSWLTVRFQDGSAIVGWKRYASSYPDNHELLLERAVYHSADRTESFKMQEVWIPTDSIKTIQHTRDSLQE